MAHLFKVGRPPLLHLSRRGLGAGRVAGTIAARFWNRLGALCCCWVLSIPTGFGRAAVVSSAPKPKPAQLSITGYGFLGNRELKRILRALELSGKKPELFGPSFVEDSALILTSKIKRDGYLRPSILIRIRLSQGAQIDTDAAALLENPLPRPLPIKSVHFYIHKGLLYYFKSLVFEGLQSAPEKKARSYFMETQTLLNIKRGRIYTPERLRQGLSSLSDILDEQGYTHAKLEPAGLRQDDKTGAVSVVIRIEEGPKFLVHSVHEDFFYQGSPHPEESKTFFPNAPDSRLWQQDFTLSIKTNQYHRGYPDTSVEVTALRNERRTNYVWVDLEARVQSGYQVRIGALEFEGQKRTRPGLLSRSVRIHRGELLDPIVVEQARYRLARLGVFNSVNLEYLPVNDQTRDVLYQVTEAKTLNVSLLFGWGSYELLRGGVEIEANNLWGAAHHADLTIIQSFKSSSGNLNYTVPELVGKDIDLFANGNGLRRQEISFLRLEYGGGVGLHKYFQQEATDVSLRYNYQILSAQDFTTFQGVSSEGLTNPAVGSIIAQVKFDRRDNPLYPRKGYKVFLTFETGTSYLGGDANYQRIILEPSWYIALGGGRYLSIGLSHGVDVSFGSAANNLPFNSRFFPGGDNSIRGYQEGEASPRNALGQILGAECYLLGSIELEQALTAKWSVVLFSDNLGFAEHIDHYPFDTALFSVGLGLSWRSLIGPVRLEYGHNLNPRPGDPSGTVLFSLGFPF